MTPNQFEDSRSTEGTLTSAGRKGIALEESKAISRDDEREGAVEPRLASPEIPVEYSPVDQPRGRRRVMAASSLTGDRVRNGKGEALGTIDEIMLDLESGRIAYAVLSYGGFPGIGDKLFAVPWSALRIDPSEHEFVFDVDRKMLENAPGFDKDNWPDMADPTFAAEIHEYYNKQASWETRVTDAGDFAGVEHSPDRCESSSRFNDKSMEKWSELMLARATDPSLPMKPQVVAHELGKRLPNNAIVTGDSGSNTTWWARHIPAKDGQMYSVSGNLASMACGLPYAIAAQLAHPGRPVFAFVGDGGFTMLMGELATCLKYHLPIRIVVIKNNSFAQIKWEQMVFLGNPEYVCDLQPIDFAGVARAFGIASFVIEDPARCGSTLDQALAVEGPVLIEAVVDPDAPPMPPVVKADQALHLAEAMVRGTKGAGDILKDIASSKVRELV